MGKTMDRHFVDRSLSLPPRFQPIPPGQRRAMDAERAKALRLRLLLDQALEGRGIKDPAEIGALAMLSPVDAEKLLIRRHWRAGDLALLEKMAERLGVQMPDA